eukprot:6886701-Prymnesium_polylepis.2
MSDRARAAVALAPASSGAYLELASQLELLTHARDVALLRATVSAEAATAREDGLEEVEWACAQPAHTHLPRAMRM